MTSGTGGLPEQRPDQQIRPAKPAIGAGGLSGVFRGRLVVISAGSPGSGLFAYSPSPGSGNLVASIATANGTDPYGNAYLAGVTSYTSSGGIFYAIQMNGQVLTLTSAASAAGPYSTIDATLALDGTFTNLVLTAANSIVLNPLNGVANLAVAFLPTQTAAPTGAAGGMELYTQNNRVHLVNPVGTDMIVVGAKTASTTTATITAATFTALNATTIIASDVQQGEIYRMTIFGYGTWGSTQQALTIQARFGASPTNVVGTAAVIAATALAANAAFQWRMTAELVCLTAGVSATWRASVSGIIAETANPLNPGTAADNSIAFATGSGATDITLDSTVNEIWGVSAEWASTTGAPTITKTIGIVEKVTM